MAGDKESEEVPPSESTAGARNDDDEMDTTSETNQEEETQEEEEKQVVRKSGRKRMPKRRDTPSPSPPRQRLKSNPSPEDESETQNDDSASQTRGKKAAAQPNNKTLGSNNAPEKQPTAQAADPPIDDEEERSWESDDETIRSDSSSIVSEDPPDLPTTRAGVYAPALRARHQRYSTCVPFIPLPPRVIGGVRDQLEKTKTCTCKRSGCLKLYCECFMSGLCCSEQCNCILCKNNDMYPQERMKAVDEALRRNPYAFRPKIINVEDTRAVSNFSFPTAAARHASVADRGCQCRKSNCLKKYCLCWVGSVFCSPPNCICIDCKNKVGDKEREKLMAKRKAKDSTAGPERSQPSKPSKPKFQRKLLDPQGEGPESVRASIAEAARAKTLAKGVDLFLPPSTYTTPMVTYGRPYPQVAFAPSNERRPRQTPPPPPKRLDKKQTCETDLEKLWRIETDRVGETFQRVRSDFLQTTQSPSPYRFKASRLTTMRAELTGHFVVNDMKYIMENVEKAEANFKRPVDEETQQSNHQPTFEQVDQQSSRGTDETSSPVDVVKNAMTEDEKHLEADLMCEEEIDSTEDRHLTDDAIRELTVLAAQETALLHRLALVIRRRTLGLTDKRLRLVEEAKKKIGS